MYSLYIGYNSRAIAVKVLQWSKSNCMASVAVGTYFLYTVKEKCRLLSYFDWLFILSFSTMEKRGKSTVVFFSITIQYRNL